MNLVTRLSGSKYFSLGMVCILFIAMGSDYDLHAQEFTAVSSSNLPRLANARAEWVDFNNDNLPDLFISGLNNSGQIQSGIYFNNGNGTFNSSSLPALSDIAYDFADYNNDHFIDIIMSGRNSLNGKSIFLLENSNGLGFTAKDFALKKLSKGSLVWRDFDIDGDADLVICGLDEKNVEATIVYQFEGGSYTSSGHSMPDVSNGTIMMLDADNNGRSEVLLSGISVKGNPVFELHSVFKNGSAIYGAPLEGSAFNSVAVSDYNSDGLSDIITTGLQGTSMVKATTIFINNTVGGFIKSVSDLPALSSSNVDAGDLNNDGYADLVLLGIDGGGAKHFKYFINSRNGFSQFSHNLPAIYSGDAALGDYDNDGDLDIFQIGNSELGLQGNLYKSNQSQTKNNNAPSIPRGLRSQVCGDSVTLYWEPSTDDLTPQAALSYNVYVSTDEEGTNLWVSPLSDFVTGYRRIMRDGNSGQKTFKTIVDLPEGRYYWSVQAIDNGFKASSFAPQNSFAVCNRDYLPNEILGCDKDIIPLTAGSSQDVVEWFSSSSGLLKSNSASLEYKIASADTVIARITSPFSCVNSDTLRITVYSQPLVHLGPDTQVCYGQDIKLKASGNFKDINWHKLPNIKIEDFELDEYRHIVYGTDTIIAEVISDQGCVARDSIILETRPLPEFSAGTDKTLCFGDTVSLEVGGNFMSVNWISANNGTLFQDNSSVSILVKEDDTIVSIVTDNHGCVNQDSVRIAVLPLPEISLGPDQSACFGKEVTIKAEAQQSSIDWHDEDGPVLTHGFDYTVRIISEKVISASVMNDFGCVNFDSVNIRVIALPYVDLGRDTAVCSSERLLLRTGSSHKAVEWFSIGENRVVGSEWFLDWKVVQDDTLIVLVESLQGCVNADSLGVEASTVPQFTLGDDLSVCRGNPVSLSIDGHWKEINWYGLSDVVYRKRSHEFSFLADQSVTIRAEVISDDNCIAYDTIHADVIPLPEFDLGTDVTVCEGDTVTLESPVAGTKYRWTDADVLLSDLDYLQLVPRRSKELLLEITSIHQCLYKDSIFVEVHPIPSFSIQAPAEICAGDAAEFVIDVPGWRDIRWSVSGNATESGQGSSFVFYPGDDTFINARLIDQHGCTATDSVQLSVHALPHAHAGDDVLLCHGEIAGLGSAAVQNSIYRWFPAWDLSDPAISNPVVTGRESGHYVLSVMDENGCTASDTVYVEVNPRISIDAGHDISICVGQRARLGGAPTAGGSKFNYSFQWFSDNGSIPGNDPNPFVQPANTTWYHVLVSSGKCEVQHDSVMVVVHALPVIEIMNDQSIGAGSGVRLSANGGTSYQWFPPESLDNAALQFPLATPLQTTRYSVLVTDTNHCADTASVLIHVQNKLFIPTLFSPNGDGVNDTFRIFGSGIDQISLSLFDQNGVRLFHSADKETIFDHGWPGQANGSVLRDGFYIWVIDGSFFNGEKLLFEGKTKGLVRLMR